MNKDIINAVINACKFKISNLTGYDSKYPSIDEMREIVLLDDAIKLFTKKVEELNRKD